MLQERKKLDNVLGETQSNFRSENYSEEFKNFQAQEQQNDIRFDSDNTEDYNENFGLREFRKAISKCHDISVGPYDIHYRVLKRLP